MRITARGKYALAAMICIARDKREEGTTTVSSIARDLGVSKIYLEQVFALLKRSGVVSSVKGAQGGYRLTRAPDKITALDILEVVESALLDREHLPCAQNAPEIDAALVSCVFAPLDLAVSRSLSAVTLEKMAGEAESGRQSGLMFYI